MASGILWVTNGAAEVVHLGLALGKNQVWVPKRRDADFRIGVAGAFGIGGLSVRGGPPVWEKGKAESPQAQHPHVAFHVAFMLRGAADDKW